MTDTWDVVGEATFSKPIGFLEKGADINDTLKVSEKALDYFALVGQIPILDFFLDKNPIIRMGPPSFSFITQLSIKFLQARLTGEDQHDPSKPDFLDKFLEAKKTHPDIVDDLMVISYFLINMIAGADTTAITLRAVIYYNSRTAEYTGDCRRSSTRLVFRPPSATRMPAPSHTWTLLSGKPCACIQVLECRWNVVSRKAACTSQATIYLQVLWWG